MTPTALRVNRALLGVRQCDLVQRVGVQPITIWRWETGRSTISPEYQQRILQALFGESAGAGSVTRKEN